jgi:Holliday junction resolvase-like predicted endonuclease
MNQINFNETTKFKKGEYGEKLVREWFESQGYLLYKCVTEGPHLIDFIAIKGKEIFGVPEVKTKARRNKYPDTGCNISHFEQYKALQEKHNLKVWMVFVDEMLGEIYGGSLDNISETYYDEKTDKIYPSKENGIIYFPLYRMEPIRKLTKQEIIDLKLLSERNYDYAKGNLDNV